MIDFITDKFRPKSPLNLRIIKSIIKETYFGYLEQRSLDTDIPSKIITISHEKSRKLYYDVYGADKGSVVVVWDRDG